MIPFILLLFYRNNMRKNLFGAVLTGALLFSVVSPTFAFQDISKESDYAQEILILEENTIIKSGGNFFPDRNVSRIEWVQMMYAADIFPTKCLYSGIRFSDTELNQWYTPALRSGVLCGGITGDQNGAFRPHDAVSYAEASTLLSRAIHGKKNGSPWYQAGIDFLAHEKIVLTESVQPETLLKRNQSAFLIQKIRELKFPKFSGEKFLESARTQKGVVTSYDTGYYAGGFPPENTGACTDVVERALRELGYDWKGLIDADMRKNPHLYSSSYDSNINFRRVRNVKIFLDRTAESLSLDEIYLPGDIVTYDQIPGSLWHIAIVSDKKSFDGTPLLLHNYGRGVVEDNFLHRWNAPKTGHYRLKL